MDIQVLNRTSDPGNYRVTTRRGEVINIGIAEDASIQVRWEVVNPKRRPLPFAAFGDWNTVFDIFFEVGQWSGVQWRSSHVPYTPTSRVTQITVVTLAELDAQTERAVLAANSDAAE